MALASQAQSERTSRLLFRTQPFRYLPGRRCWNRQPSPYWHRRALLVVRLPASGNHLATHQGGANGTVPWYSRKRHPKIGSRQLCAPVRNPDLIASASRLIHVHNLRSGLVMTPATNDSDSYRPLSGKRVIEFGLFHAGPTCAAMLGALGAEVIKVEDLNKGDPARGLLRLYGQDCRL